MCAHRKARVLSNSGTPRSILIVRPGRGLGLGEDDKCVRSNTDTKTDAACVFLGFHILCAGFSGQ
jgi:hypothetical protein